MNRLIKKFKERNPSFTGNISLIGHSLGSVICYDLLTHQNEHQHDEHPNTEMKKYQNEKFSSASLDETETLENFLNRLNLIEFKNLFEKEKITMANMVYFICSC